MPAPALLIIVALALLAAAWRVLASHARGGHDISMGAAGVFSGLWLLGAACVGAGLSLASGWRGWPAAGLGLVGLIAIYAARGVIYRVIVRRNLGLDAPPLPRNGFKDFLRRTENEKRPE